MTVNSFEKGGDGGGPSACDGHFHSNKDHWVALPPATFDHNSNCFRKLKISARGKSTVATVIDECAKPCKDDIVDASESVWKALGVHRGISCDTFNNVTVVDLTGASISGNLTSAICALSNLTALTLQRKAFTGPSPIGLLHCKHLHKLDLSSTNFAGTLPTCISELSKLRILKLPNNSFSGSIPPAFRMVAKLEALFFHENSLSGEFPNFFGELKSLKNLTFDNNPLRPGVLPVGSIRVLRRGGLNQNSR
ncbi:disease resistance protein BAK6-like [Cryptomeria japonica]|uniref:disease resistance protein BAK6-like n=1 Tax=Cryptomeria japonica TaxID=3369 RepID=UPI0027DA06CF|nr:disease resistance protein BAK6-like [Cryptomeria japonica]